MEVKGQGTAPRADGVQRGKGENMERTRYHEIEGTILEIPLIYDQRSGQWIEEYPDFLEQPVYTPAGERILLTIEDACPHGRLRPDGMGDCGSCMYYRQVPGTLLGVCGNDSLRVREREQVIKSGEEDDPGQGTCGDAANTVKKCTEEIPKQRRN